MCKVHQEQIAKTQKVGAAAVWRVPEGIFFPNGFSSLGTGKICAYLT
jgi:hypothetical protein